MALNLALDPWIPVAHVDGSRTMIAPWQVTAQSPHPGIRVDHPHSPWNGALTEFLVALFQTALFPSDAREWRAFWERPPEPQYLRKQCEKVADYFHLDGDRPFMQDPGLVAGPVEVEKIRKPVQKLLVDGVSREQEKKNSDLFVKSGRLGALCLGCAAAALWDLQIHAPQGSASYFTSPRGGGPLTTLVVSKTLWHTIWANVLEEAGFGMKGRPEPSAFLPWVAYEERTVTAADECPLHILWPMPRRVLLEIQSDGGACDACGLEATKLVRSFLTARGGLQYRETDWRHPLSPYIRSAKKESQDKWLVRPTEGILAGYRDWMGMLVDTPKGDGLPAQAVRRWVSRDAPGEPDLHLWGFGYEAEQAAVVLWCEGRMPIIRLPNGYQKGFEAFGRTLVWLSQRGVERLSAAIEGAWKASGRALGGRAREAENELWRSTDPAFREEMRAAASDPQPENLSKRADGWMKAVQKAAMSLYERYAPAPGILPQWLARFSHKLCRELGSRNPATMKTRRFGDWRITDV